MTVPRRIRQLEPLQLPLDRCFGCGCLSLGTCTRFSQATKVPGHDGCEKPMPSLPYPAETRFAVSQGCNRGDRTRFRSRVADPGEKWSRACSRGRRKSRPLIVRVRAARLGHHLGEACFLPCRLTLPESSDWGLCPLESSHAMHAVVWTARKKLGGGGSNGCVRDGTDSAPLRGQS